MKNVIEKRKEKEKHKNLTELNIIVKENNVLKNTSNKSPAIDIMPAVPDCCSVAQAMEASIESTSSNAKPDAIYNTE